MRIYVVGENEDTLTSLDTGSTYVDVYEYGSYSYKGDRQGTTWCIKHDDIVISGPYDSEEIVRKKMRALISEIKRVLNGAALQNCTFDYVIEMDKDLRL